MKEKQEKEIWLVIKNLKWSSSVLERAQEFYVGLLMLSWDPSPARKQPSRDVSQEVYLFSLSEIYFIGTEWV